MSAIEIAELEEQRTKVLQELAKIMRKYNDGPARDRAICDTLMVITSAHPIERQPEVQKSNVDLEMEIFNIGLIKFIDECIRKHCYDITTKIIKYDDVSEAIIANRDGILISINDVCYLFENEEIYKQFLIPFQLHVLHKFKTELNLITIQHVTLPNMKQKGLLTYNSIDETEINNAIVQLSDISDELLESIDFVRKDSTTKIIMHNLIGTPTDLHNKLTKYCTMMKEQFNDEKMSTDSHVIINGFKCYYERLTTIILSKYGDRVLSPMFNIITDKKTLFRQKHALAEDFDSDENYETLCWIDENPPKKKNVKQYYKKYCDQVDDYVSMKKFNKIMEEMNYTKNKHGGRIYWVSPDDESSENNTDAE